MTLSSIYPNEPEAPSGTWGGGFFEILFVLLVFVCILFLAYIVTRLVAKRASGRLKSRHIEVMDTLAIGADAQFLIIKIGDELFLTAKSQKQLTLLTKLEITPETLEENAARAPGFAGGFRAVLESKLGFPHPRVREDKPPGAGFHGNIDKLKRYAAPPGDFPESFNGVPDGSGDAPVKRDDGRATDKNGV